MQNHNRVLLSRPFVVYGVLEHDEHQSRHPRSARPPRVVCTILLSLRAFLNKECRYDSAGASEPFQAHSLASMGAGGSSTFNRNEMRTLADVKESQIGQSDKAEFFSCRSTVVHIKQENMAYPACPDCNKKVVDSNEGWRCEKCDKSHSAPLFRCAFYNVEKTFLLTVL